jgi:hypothetical protein
MIVSGRPVARIDERMAAIAGRPGAGRECVIGMGEIDEAIRTLRGIRKRTEDKRIEVELTAVIDRLLRLQELLRSGAIRTIEIAEAVQDQQRKRG